MKTATETTVQPEDWSLIGPGDPPPYTFFNGTGRAPWLLVCDHASRVVPRALDELGLTQADLARHIAWDIGAADLTRSLAQRFDAPAVLAGYSRLVIDNNRALDDATSIVATSDGTAIPGNRDLAAAQRAERVHAIFEPYHRAIDGRLEEFRRRSIVPALLSIHSFTPVMNGNARPWHVGVLWDRDARIAVPLMENLAATGEVTVGDNLPYSGRHPADYTVARHAERAGLPHVCIEVRQDLIETPQGVERWSELLARSLAPILNGPNLRMK